MTSDDPKPPPYWPAWSGVWQRLLLPLALLLWITPALPFLGIGAPIGSGDARPAPTDPPGWAFAIWFPIFGLYTVFAVHAWRRDERLSQQLSLLLAIAGMTATGWMADEIAGGHGPASLAGIGVITLSAFAAALVFDRMRGLGGSPVKRVADALTGLLAGWASVALAVAIPIQLRAWLGLGPTDAPWPMVGVSLAILAGLAAVFANLMSRSLWYFAALAWGIVGLFAANWWGTGLTLVAIAYAAAGAVILWRRLRHGARGAHYGLFRGARA